MSIVTGIGCGLEARSSRCLDLIESRGPKAQWSVSDGPAFGGGVGGGPGVGVEGGVAATVHEHQRAAEEAGVGRQQEREQVGHLGGAAGAVLGDGVHVAQVHDHVEVVGHQRGVDEAGGHGVEPDARADPVVADGGAANPAGQRQLAGGIGRARVGASQVPGLGLIVVQAGLHQAIGQVHQRGTGVGADGHGRGVGALGQQGAQPLHGGHCPEVVDRHHLLRIGTGDPRASH